MSAMQKGLGRGLGALFQDEPAIPPRAGSNTVSLPLSRIYPNPDQPRRDFEPAALDELAQSIREQGLIQPILVRPGKDGQSGKYEIVAGERRWRASQLAGLSEVPVVVRELTDAQSLALALIENLQREDLNPLEEARGMQRLKEEFGFSQDEVARQLGKSRSAVANCLRLLNLSQNAQQNLREGLLSAGHARALLAFEDPEQQEKIRKRILEEKLSVREVEGLAHICKEDAARTKKTETRRAAARKPQSAVMAALQSRVSAAMSLPVKISGRENKGRLNISYSSKAELQALLEKLGIGDIN